MERLELTVCSCIGANVLSIAAVAAFEKQKMTQPQMFNRNTIVQYLKVSRYFGNAVLAVV